MSKRLVGGVCLVIYIWFVQCTLMAAKESMREPGEQRHTAWTRSAEKWNVSSGAFLCHSKFQAFSFNAKQRKMYSRFNRNKMWNVNANGELWCIAFGERVLGSVCVLKCDPALFVVRAIWPIYENMVAVTFNGCLNFNLNASRTKLISWIRFNNLAASGMIFDSNGYAHRITSVKWNVRVLTIIVWNHWFICTYSIAILGSIWSMENMEK